MDYLLALPEQLDRHSGTNYSHTVYDILQKYKVCKENLGWFVTDNAYANDACNEALGEIYGFDKSFKRVRCAAHCINLAAQAIMYGTDKESFENAEKHVPEEEEFLRMWRREGPLVTLMDIIYSVNTPYLNELLEGYQIEEKKMLPVAGLSSEIHLTLSRSQEYKTKAVPLRAKGKTVPDPTVH